MTNTNSLPRLNKLWRTAQTRANFQMQKMVNNNIELGYHRILRSAKQRLASHLQPVFERDQKQDDRDSATALHSFISNSFYFHLECDFQYDYRVTYAFCHCPYEQEIRELLSKYPFDARAKEVVLKPDFNTFYKAVLAYQHKRYQYVLKA